MVLWVILFIQKFKDIVGEKNIMDRICELVTYVFDPLHSFWERKRTQQVVAALLVAVFLGSLLGIEANRQGLLPVFLASHTPANHFHSVGLAFTLVLILEVVGFIFSVPCSIAKSVGKQFEILAIILLRSSFKELAKFAEPVSLVGHLDALWRIAADASGALVVFVLLGFFLRVQQHKEEMKNPQALFFYVSTKKLMALILLGLFIAMSAFNVWNKLIGGGMIDFFPSFFTLLIFADILLVLISHIFFPSFRAVFRNSGFAVATLLIRLALTAPPFINVLVGIGSVVFALCLTLACNVFYSVYSGKV